MKQKLLNTLSLFTSFSTLICCALPALMVTLGMGAALAGFIGEFPQFIWISEQKIWFFSVGGALLLSSLYLEFFRQPVACPIGELQEACTQTKNFSKPVLIVSLVFYLIGFSFAYVIPLFL